MKNMYGMKYGIKYGILYVFLIILYILLDSLGWENKPEIIHIFMIIAICMTLGIGFLKLDKSKFFKDNKENSCKDINKNNNEAVVGMVILALGLIMRIGYTMYTPWNIREHDVGSAFKSSTGHAAYIVNLFYSLLPGSNENQFYHPPLYHFLSSITMHIVNLYKKVPLGEFLIDSAKLIPCFASCGVLFQVNDFLKDIDIKGKIANIILTIVAFCPNFYLMAGRVNNDSLVFFFMVIAIRYTYKWYYKQDWKSIIVLAITYGLGMMTKISMGVLAIFTAIFMIIVLVKNIKKHSVKPTILQLIIFGLISLPLGLWYPIRNLILFNQPLNYVLRLVKNHPVYVGDYSLSERFLLHINDFKDLNLYNRIISDYNIPLYIWRGSLFGEFTLNANKIFEWILLISNGILIIISIISMISVLIHIKEKREIAYGLFLVWICQIISFISFNIDYPFACTMDFRYIVTTVIVGAIFIGLFCRQIMEKKNMVCRIGIGFIYSIILTYVISSIIVYLSVK